MPKATHTDTTPTRAPAPDLAPIPPTASVDAPLLVLVAEFQRVDARLMELNAESTADAAGTKTFESLGGDVVHDRWWAIVDRVIELPSHTVPGWAAMAAMIPRVIRDVSSTAIGTADINLALSLVRDIAGQNNGSPDVDLLVACEAFHATHRKMKDRGGETLTRMTTRWVA